MKWADFRDNLELPARIEQCPILEAIVDFQFETKLPSDAVFGVIYSAVRESFDAKVETLPVLQLPEAIRNKDPGLVNQPHYRLRLDNTLIQVGPRVISFINLKPYSGWRDFFAFVQTRSREVAEAKVVERVRRVGVRYINFIDGDVWEKVQLGLVVGEDSLPSTRKSLEAELRTGGFTSVVRIANRTALNNLQGTHKGSVLDIDCFAHVETTLADAVGVADRAHLEEKKTFFALLTEPFLKELRPVYEQPNF